MGRKSRVGTLSSTHSLITGAWKTDVETMETAIGDFTTDRPLANDCRVAFFEIVRDGHLHVNVTHRYPTKAVTGWAGPASMPDGFVHNRTFDDTPPSQMIRHIRNMVFAARI